MSDPDLPIALRPIGEFPNGRTSIFEDPGDEKSWHQSQRSESLERFYEGRDASWYASAIRPLSGARRVVDLGCGPGLTLEALLAQGASSVLGVDRWPAFARGAGPRAPIALHDLTLPMPFLPSGSFDGVLSHYALDYVSPIGMRQVLREAHRILAPGGRLLIYVAAVGLGSGDETRTSPYSAAAMTMLLQEAGFAGLEVEASPNGRNTIAQARRDAIEVSDSQPPKERPGSGGVIATPVSGEVQLSAGLSGVDGERLEIVAGGQPEAILRLELPGIAANGRLGVCARVVAPGRHGAELQAWAWQDGRAVAAESLRLEAQPMSLRIEGGGQADHVDVWTPAPLALEPTGSAYARATELADANGLDESARGAEGRLIVVEPEQMGEAAMARAIGQGRNRFPIRRPGAPLSIPELDRDWLEGRALGAVLSATRLTEEDGLQLGLWASSRQALLLVEGASWEEIAAALRQRLVDLSGPVLAIDPELCGQPSQPLGEGIVALATVHDNLYPVLGAEAAATDRLTPLRNRLLRGGTRAPEAATADEGLRLLTERALLMRLRRRSERPLAELGRRPSLA